MLRGGTSEKTFFEILDRAVRDARLRFLVEGRAVDVGGLSGAEPDIVVRVDDKRMFRRVLAEGNLGLGETFMEGGWTVERGSLEGFLKVLVLGRLDEIVRLEPRLLLQMGILRAKQLVAGGRANSQAHYDVGEDLYDTFLDATRGYTCGYQTSPDDTIEQLQENKYERICKKLRLRAGESFFDVGCGYGGLAIHAAQHYGVRASGITNSDAHGVFALRRVRELGLEDRVKIQIGDFRSARGRYDKVASVGLFEHLFPYEHRAFFKTVTRLLHPDGSVLLHTIGCVTATNEHDPFIQKYVFPGSTQNPLSHISAWFERSRLGIVDVENVARHYAPTSQAWLDRFRARRHTLDPKKYDATFLRMWEYYLALCVAGASHSDGAVWQVLGTAAYRKTIATIWV